MDHLDIKTEQAKELEKKIFAIRSYLRTMQGRIRELRFPVDDDLKVKVDKAESAVSDLQGDRRRADRRPGAGDLHPAEQL